MTLQRIIRMSPVEIASRGWQEASKTVSRLTTSPDNRPACVFSSLKRSTASSPAFDLFNSGERERAAQELLQTFKQQAPQRFFAGTVQPEVESFIGEHCPEERQRIIGTADAVSRGEFEILGYECLSFGSPPDWHLDAISGQRSPFVHWSKLNPLDPDSVGDSKVVWELNRHQWMLDLGQAYRFTGDERYAQTFARLLQDWMQHNPPGMGINWSSSLEVAMRLISWCWALILFRDARALTPALFVDMLAWMRSHANYVERYLSYYFSPNTHLTGEALGLFYAGSLLVELQESERWAALGRRVLLEQLERQVYADGVYFEQSTRYQCYTVEFYLHFLILARRNGQELPAGDQETLQRMLDFLLAVRRPDGSLPQIGDTDGGWLVPLVRRPPEDCRNLFALGAALFQRSDFAWAAGEPVPELLWLLGSTGLEEFRFLQAAPPASTRARLFPQGGYVVMRNQWEDGGHQLIFDTGPFGCCYSAGHGHADLLSVQCAAFGEAFLVDAGTACYTPNRKWRDYFRSSAAHNTLMLDGHSQAATRGPFNWQPRLPMAHLNHLESAQEVELADAWHDAWHHQPDPVTHRRRVLFVHSRYWVIVDDLTGRDEHEVELRYQFAPAWVSEESDGWVRARGQRGHALLLRTFSTSELHQELRTGALNPTQGWVSPNYGQRIPAPALSCKGRGRLPLRIVTLLLPLKEAEAPAPEVAVLKEEEVTGLQLDGDTVRINEHNIFLDTQTFEKEAGK